MLAWFHRPCEQCHQIHLKPITYNPYHPQLRLYISSDRCSPAP